MGATSVQKRYHVEKHGSAPEIAIPKAKTPFVEFGGSSLGPKLDQKSIKKRSQNRSAFLVRFLVDLGSILGGFWKPTSTQNRSKIQSKKRTSKPCPWVTEGLAHLVP